ncbi:ATP-binding protein [Wolinella succinogenes]|uniref:sensor histidine kinase n=1 Tax=Wolinella succinogenes TaxID=844 RepID=UPI002408FD5B|nr:ATP-binding protein [Wolinella succinogenes]
MIVQIANRLFPRLSLGSRTRFLVFNIASGLLSLGVVSYIALYSIKYDFDDLFRNHTVSLTKLEEIKNNYTANIYGTLIELEKGHITPHQAKEAILLSEYLIADLWKSYKHQQLIQKENRIISVIKQIHKRFFQDDTQPLWEPSLSERAMISKTEEKILLGRQISEEVFALLALHKESEATQKIRQELYPSINIVNTYLSQLIRHKLNSAAIGKRSTDNLYQTTLKLIIIMMCLIMIVTLFLSALILKTIENLHYTLEEKVAEKTKELQELNATLERCIACEVQESRKKDQIMYQQARLASMGEMIQNIAHQWRQPLNALTMLIQSFKSKADNGKLDKEFVEHQVKEGLRIAKGMSETIEDFRGFFRPNKTKEVFSVLESVRDCISLVETLYKQSEIGLFVQAKDDLRIVGYKNAFSQVILNIIKNAEDILMEKEIHPKRIKITLERIEIYPTKMARVSIVDNAGGIVFDDIQKVFEPYFTTKHKSVGTGIGLYMSKQIIEKQMNGRIEVMNSLWYCETDHKTYTGAMFIITVPIKNENEIDEGEQ